ncbi:peptide chain release factor 1 [Gloeocapsopsis dulcis]|uniref:Peptide chain release factor 1 n=1 Tax=Gloeocapsopsis dulcis AAB1 = 1H9 TaxID=1433147 RepID=A0A6N8FU40_9CHRO|nr:peptide chain release factor 1 [Gloeocapsopsis dulcis]MUL36623.1 peptide chain release factor 1 [Gloeocapsopsis dulcis AAB1 = 1H9]WNN87247.1 peptide chain release factor 1 [Gloeocapsopsis dulcis]
MHDPLRSLKFLPWRSLLQVSLLVAVVVIVLDFLLVLGYIQSNVFQRLLMLVYAPPLGIVISLAISVGLGALGVYLLERFYRLVSINTGSLWALVLCLAVVLFLKTLLPLPAVLFNLNQAGLIGIIIGVFWKGRPYWR